MNRVPVTGNLGPLAAGVASQLPLSSGEGDLELLALDGLGAGLDGLALCLDLFEALGILQANALGQVHRLLLDQGGAGGGRCNSRLQNNLSARAVSAECGNLHRDINLATECDRRDFAVGVLGVDQAHHRQREIIRSH